jgi:hypothetical protein
MDRKKYEDLKLKYKNLTDKAKERGLRNCDIPDIEDSQGFLNLTMKTPHLTEDPLIQTTLMQTSFRKPGFNQSGSSTIGGFGLKKKDEKIKFLN